MNYLENNGNNPFRIFDYKNLGSVRTSTLENGEPVFCLPDLCGLLDIKNSRRVLERLRRDGVHTMNTIDNLGRFQPLTFINEPNVYEVIFNSRKPEAENIKWWVFNEVLPSIRRTGMYIPDTKEGLMTAAMQTITEGFRRQEEINKKQAKFNEKQLKTNSNLTTRIIHLEDDLYTERMLNLNMIREHAEVMRNTYLSILAYMRYQGIPDDSVDTLRMGRLASKMCRERRIETVKIKDNRFGYVNGYPYELLDELFDNELYAQ